MERKPSGRADANRRPQNQRPQAGRQQGNRNDSARGKSRAEAVAKRRAAQKRKRMILLTFVAFLLLVIIIAIAQCSNNNGGDRENTILGDIVEHPVLNGTRGVIYTNKDDATDAAVIEFLNTHDISEYSWFTIDFGNGTGYHFTNRILFSYGPITENGGVSEQPFQYARVHDNHIEWSTVFEVPQFRTVAEYYDWANHHSIEVGLISISRLGESLSVENYLEHEVVDHPLSAVEGDVMHIRIE